MPALLLHKLLCGCNPLLLKLESSRLCRELHMSLSSPLCQVIQPEVQLVTSQVEIQVEEISDAEDDQSVSRPAAVDPKAAVAEDLPASEAGAMPSAGQPAAADADGHAADMDVDIRESTQEGDKPARLAEKLPEGVATGPWPSAAAADAAVSLSASKHETPPSSLAHTMPKVDAAAVLDMPDSKPSASDSLPQVADSKAAVGMAAPAGPAALEHGVNGKATPNRSDSPSSHRAGSCLPSPGSKSGSPKSSLAYIPLGKAAVAKAGSRGKAGRPQGVLPQGMRACSVSSSWQGSQAAASQGWRQVHAPAG